MGEITYSEMVAKIDASDGEGQWILLKRLRGDVMERMGGRTLGPCGENRLSQRLRANYERITGDFVRPLETEMSLTPAVASWHGRNLREPVRVRRGEHTSMLMDMEMVDRAWKDGGEWTAPGQSKAPWKMRKVVAAFEVDAPLQMPTVIVADRGDRPVVFIEDGTHRFMALRDAGGDAILMALPTERDVDIVKKYKMESKHKGIKSNE